MNHYQRIVDALHSPKVADLHFVLEQAVLNSADSSLQAYAGTVLAIIKGPVLRQLHGANKPIPLPLDRPPYNALLRYCRQRMASA